MTGGERLLPPRRDELLASVEAANDEVAQALVWAAKTADKEDMRPSTAMAFDRIQAAHTILTKIDPSRSIETETNGPEDTGSDRGDSE